MEHSVDNFQLTDVISKIQESKQIFDWCSSIDFKSTLQSSLMMKTSTLVTDFCKGLIETKEKQAIEQRVFTNFGEYKLSNQIEFGTSLFLFGNSVRYSIVCRVTLSHLFRDLKNDNIIRTNHLYFSKLARVVRGYYQIISQIYL